jgi:hypothetical protein
MSDTSPRVGASEASDLSRPTMAQRVQELSITLRVTSVPGFSRDPDDGWEHNSYRLTLSRPDFGYMRLTWRQGLAIQTPPDAATVLDCIASDAAGFVNAGTFEEWTRDYGYDSDSRRAEKIYRAVERQTTSLRRVLGDDFDAVVFETKSL